MKLHKRNRNAILAGSVLFAMAAGLALPGCGSNDPTKKYSSIKKEAVPPGQAAVDTTAINTSNVLNIEALTQYMYFYEGQSSTYYFKSNLQLDNVKYTIQQANLPSDLGISVTAVPDSDVEHKGMVALSWTPKLGTLGASNDREYKFLLALVPNAGTEASAAKFLNEISRARPFAFRLLKSQEVPTFKSADKINGAAEGKRQQFSVVVKDLASNGNRQPSLIAYRDKTMSTSSAVPLFDASSGMFVMGEAEALGNNEFKFTVTFDGSSITMPSGSGPAKAHVLFRVNSSSGLESLDQVYEFDVARKAGASTSTEKSSTTPAPAVTKKDKSAPRAGSTTQNGGGK